MYQDIEETGVPETSGALPAGYPGASHEDGIFDLGFDTLPEFLNDNRFELGNGAENSWPIGEVGESFSEPLDCTFTPALDDSSQSASPKFPTKIGSRFSIETVSILRKWFTANKDHPYPTDMDKETLQAQTGLSRTQIVNWLSNARRRMLLQPGPRSSWWHEDTPATRPINVPARPGTPALRRPSTRSLNPMERWVDSPPEHEPATVTDIARAIGSDPLCKFFQFTNQMICSVMTMIGSSDWAGRCVLSLRVLND